MSAADPKATAVTDPHGSPRGPKPIRIFTYPKIVFIAPTLVMSIICWIGMLWHKDETRRPSLLSTAEAQQQQKATSPTSRSSPNAPTTSRAHRTSWR